MKKNNSFSIVIIIGILIIVGVVGFFITKYFRKYNYYVHVNDGKTPGTTYTLQIDKEGNYNMKGVFGSDLGIDETYEEEHKYNGKFSKEIMDKIKLVSKKIGSTKMGYTLYFDNYSSNMGDNNYEEKLYSSVLLVKSITRYYNGDIDEASCMLDKIVNQTITEDSAYNIEFEECSN